MLSSYLFSVCDPLLVLFMFFFFLMIRRPPRSTLDRSSAASDVYKRQDLQKVEERIPLLKGRAKKCYILAWTTTPWTLPSNLALAVSENLNYSYLIKDGICYICAVSYTHLRAHETVLDLVCRLLLEKKTSSINI